MACQVIESDMVFWTAGSGPVTKTAAQQLSLPFPTDKRGLMQTDAMLRVLRQPHVFAMGDIAGVAESNPKTTPPPTAQVTITMPMQTSPICFLESRVWTFCEQNLAQQCPAWG